jgi:hypothetical protein
VKALFLGSAPAAALGLLLGGAARPELALYEASPPMEPATATYASYAAEPPPFSGQVPNYALGSDWARRRSAALSPSETEPPAETYVFAQYEYVEPPPIDDWEPASAYPSLDGDILAGTERAPPPTIEVVSPAA